MNQRDALESCGGDEENVKLLRNRTFLLRCIERYLHAAQTGYLDGANELVRLYFSQARSESAGESVIGEIDRRVKTALGCHGERKMYSHLSRFTRCAMEGLRNPNHTIDQKFWHAIDDIVEVDLMMNAIMQVSLTNPDGLIERVKKEYNRIAPLNNGVGSPDHVQRYKDGGEKR